MKAISLSIIAASLLILGSCSDQMEEPIIENPVQTGDEINFGTSLPSQIETRTAYGDEVTTGGDYDNGYFPVYWEEDDVIAILCPDASNETRVDYKITPDANDKTTSTDVTKIDPDKAGLQWGTEDEHEFFGFYPASALTGETNTTDGIVTVDIPERQNPVRWEQEDGNTWVGIGNTDYAYMWAYAKVKKSKTPVGTAISLPFEPMSTVLEITINGPKNGQMAISSVNINSIDQSGTGTANTILTGEVECNIKAASTNGTGQAECKAVGNMNEVRNRIYINLYNAKGDGQYPVLYPGDKLRVYAYLLPKDENIEKGNIQISVSPVNQANKVKTLQTDAILAHAVNKVSLPALDEGGTEDANYWMSSLNPDIYLTELSWPGSKMSAITYEKGVDNVPFIGEVHNGYTQNSTLTKQFELGVRAFDFPTVYSGNSIELGRETYIASTEGIGISLKGALDELATCLTKAEAAGKKQEAVFVNISYAASRFILSRDRESQWLTTLINTYNDWKNDKIYESEVNNNTTLGDVAGKIILRVHIKGEDTFNQFTTLLPVQLACYNEPYSLTPGAMSWGMASNVNGLQLLYEDQTRLANEGVLDLTTNDGTPDEKKTNVAAVVQESVNQYINNRNHNIWYLIDLGGFYTTAFLTISIYNGEAAAEELTPHFFKFFNTREQNASLGTVYMNFADDNADYGAKYGCDYLIQTIIDNNFSFQLRTRGNTGGTTRSTSSVTHAAGGDGWDE